MTYWLLKSEPDDYSWADLERDGSTVWDGVSNNAALKRIREARPGDEAFLYHTGKERSCVGIVRVTSDPYPDPQADDERLAVFDVEPVRALERPVTLAEIKADPAFEGWELVRLPRLSVMEVPEDLWRWVLELARS